MPWREPRYDGEFPSLGWQVIQWMHAYLRVPNGADYGAPLRLTDSQKSILVRFYALHPVTGQRIYRRAAVRLPKGWGKSPLLAAITWAEFCGPVVFAGWDAAGEPVGVEHQTPWCQIAAVSEDQTTNTYSHLFEMVRDSDIVDDYDLQVGLSRVSKSGGRIEPVTASAGSREGQPVTFAVLDEPHLWLPRNGGKRLADVIRRNVAKMGGTTFESTNAHKPGEGSVAELTMKAAHEGRAGLLYIAREPSVLPESRDDIDTIRQAIAEVYEGAPWVPLARILAETQDPATDWSDAQRFYLNVIVADEFDVVNTEIWDSLERPAEVLRDGDHITLGFDGSETEDATVLFACRWPDFTIFELGVWENPGSESWRVPRLQVEAAVDQAMTNYRVVRAYADPPYWRTEIDKWEAEYGKGSWIRIPTASDQRIAAVTERFDTMVNARSLGWAPSEVLRRHITAARREPVRGGWRPAKKDSRKIDATIAAMLAVHAMGDAVAAGQLTVETSAVDLFMASATWACPNGHMTLNTSSTCKTCGAGRAS